MAYILIKKSSDSDIVSSQFPLSINMTLLQNGYINRHLVKPFTDANEMERFKEACADEFALIPATPRPKPAETLTTGEASQSPVKTRKTAACGNYKVTTL